MCIYHRYSCIYLQDMKFVRLKLSLGWLYTDTDDDTDDTNNADDNNNNTTRRIEHDCIGSLPNEPKTAFKE